MSLKRQHIFDDILGGGSSIYHSAILTCYSFDPFFYSSFFRPQLSVRGIINQLVLIDAGCLDEATENERKSVLPGSSFEGYTPLRIECPIGGVFHPKLGLYIGEKRITAVIGSGNLTYSGMSYNDEAWCAFSVSSQDSQDAPVIAAIWSYLKAIISRNSISSAELQLGWMLENSALLQGVDALGASEWTSPDPSGETFSFAANVPSEPVFDKIIEAVGDAKVKSIRICAPFFDQGGAALKRFSDTLSPSRIDCLVIPDEGTLPVKLNREAYPSIRFFNFELPDEKSSRFVHAKMIQIETSQGTVFAIGSANASVQALGGNGKYSNDEADIIIRCDHKRDYLKELGIIATDEIADISIFHQCTKTEEQKKSSPQLVIQSCELLEDGYHISISKGTANNADILLEDELGRHESTHKEKVCCGVITISCDSSLIARKVFLEKDGERISNKCVVIIRSEVERKNPDKLMAPITRLLENAQDSAAFEKLLQYVHIEEETQMKAGVRLSSSAKSSSSQKSSKQELTEADFQNKVFRNRLATLEQINDRILDRLASLLTASSEDWSHMEMPQDVDAGTDSIDKGLPEDDDVVQTRNEPAVREYSLMDEGRGFFRRVLKYYDSLSWNKKEYQKNESVFLIKRPFYLLEASDLSFSAICIAVYEMCKITKNGEQDDWEEMIDYFITLIGSYLLIYRIAPADDNAAAATKRARKHRNLFIYSLLLISFWSDYGIREDLLKLLTLNLFDSFKDNLEDLKDAFKEYTDLLSKGLLPAEEDSIQMVNDAYKSYLSFKAKIDRKKGQLSPSLSFAIIYKKSFGFILLKDLQEEKSAKSEIPLVKCSAIAPGFPELIFTSKRRNPIRGMIPETALNQSALIFEKN